MIKDFLQFDQQPLESALYLVATPIGNLGDITLRALKVLEKACKVYCEDTRISQKLLSAYGLKKLLATYHEHNAEHVRPKILEELKSGLSIALISDAGMPLISDPGYKLVRACYDEHLNVTVVPGPSSVLTALALSGLPTDQFTFYGFYSKKKKAEYQANNSTLVLFEAPHRIIQTLEDLTEIFPDRVAVLARELTKKFEERRAGTVTELLAHYQEFGAPKGEIVLVLGPWKGEQMVDLDAEIFKALKTMRLKEAAEYVAITTNISKKKVYARALELRAAHEPT